MPARSLIGQVIIIGTLAAAALVAVYVGIISILSGWELVKLQWLDNWPFVVSLAIGFGIQAGLYTYLKQSIAAMHGGGATVVVSGTTSGAAMVACCAHYLVNAAAIIGLGGAVSLVAQYQRQLFWVGILFNLAGIAYLTYQVVQFHAHDRSHSTYHTSA